MAAFRLTIDGTERQIALESVDVRFVVNAPDILTCDVDDDSAATPAYEPPLDGVAVLYRTDVSPEEVIFAGIIQTASEKTLTGYGYGRKTQITAHDYSLFASFVTVSAVLAGVGSPPGSLSAALQDLVNDYLADYGVTLHPSQAAGPTLDPLAFDGETVETALKKLSQQTGWVWKIDSQKRLRMWDPATELAGFNVTATNGTYLTDIPADRYRQDYANRVIVLGGEGRFPLYGETKSGDGSTRTFLLDAPLDYFGGTTYPVFLHVTRSGIEAVEYVDGVAWIYDASDYSISNGTAATLASGDSFWLQYWAQYPMRIVADGRGSPPAPSRDITIYRPDLFSRAAMQTLADAALVASQVNFQRPIYETSELDIRPGQTQTITLPEAHLSGSFTCSEAQLKHVPGGDTETFRMTVTAVNAAGAQSIWMDLYRRWYQVGFFSPTSTHTSLASSTGTLQAAAGSEQDVQSNGGGQFAADPSFKHDRTAKSVTVNGVDGTVIARGLIGGPNVGVEAIPALLRVIGKRAGDGHAQISIGHSMSEPEDDLLFWLIRGAGLGARDTGAYIEHEGSGGLAIFEYGGELQLSGIGNLLSPSGITATYNRLQGLNHLYGMQPRTQRITSTTHTIDSGVSESNITTGYIYAGSAAGTFTLPALSAFHVFNTSSFPRLLFIKNDSAFVLTLDGNSSETIDGWLTYPMLPGWSVALLGWGGTGSKWQVLHAHKPPVVRTLTDSEIRALPTTFLDIIPTAGAGFRIKPISSTLQINNTSGDYTNINGTYAGIYLTSTFGHLQALPLWEDPAYGLSQITDFLAGANGRKYSDLQIPYIDAVDNAGPLGSREYVATSNTNRGVDEIDNDAIQIQGDNNGSGNWTGGHSSNTLRVSVLADVEATP